MSKAVICPKCKSEYTYESGALWACTQCFFEWDPAELKAAQEHESKVFDANGNELQDGDSVVVIKDLPVKECHVQNGTKVKNIRLTDGDHNIDCKLMDLVLWR